MGTIHHDVWIDAPTSTVFEAVTSRAGLDAWWGKAVRAEPEVGSIVEFDHGLGAPLLMRILDLVRDTHVSWRCISDFSEPGNPGSEWLGHRLSFDLRSASDEPDYDWLGRRFFPEASPADVTILTFRHAGWQPGARWEAFCNYAWGVTLQELSRHCHEASRRA